MTLWCRVLALLAFIAFVVSNQSEDTKSGALDTSYDESLDLRLNHIITKRDAKDPENKKTKRKQRKNNKNNKNKNKLSKKEMKLRKQRKRKQKKLSKQASCSSTQANYTCMAAALKGLLFEQQQITNYLKQSKTLDRHQSVSGNKQGKKNAFEEAEQHLLWAIGGDIDNPICGPNDTSSSKYNRWDCRCLP